MTGLAARVLAAIDEIEAIASTAAKFGGATWSVEEFVPSESGALPSVAWVIDEAEEGMAMVNGETRARHIALHDPAAVLRSCAADRVVLDLCEPATPTTLAVVAALAEGYGITEEAEI